MEKKNGYFFVNIFSFTFHYIVTVIEKRVEVREAEKFCGTQALIVVFIPLRSSSVFASIELKKYSF